jgi:putative transposase
MSLNMLHRGVHVRIGPATFVILKKLDGASWQLENTATGEWSRFTEEDLLDRFARHELIFERPTENRGTATDTAYVDRGLSGCPVELVAAAQSRVQYLKEIDRQQPIAITSKSMQPLIRSVSERISDTRPPGWRTLARDYRKWLDAGRDVRAIIRRDADRGSRAPRLVPEVKSVIDEVITELYMTPERKRVPEIHLEIVRRLADANRFRPASIQLPMPSQRAIYREIERRSPYAVLAARYGKRRAEMEFRVSGIGPETSRALQRVSMDHTPSDIIVVDDNTMLPLGRPTLTSALDEHTRCPTGFYMGFEPPSCLSVMRCLKHAILPKTYVRHEFSAIRHSWECYGVPELVVVDNPPEFHSSHFERACLQIGADIQYAKVLVPWYKGKIERFQGTMNHDLMQGNPGTTFSNILERDEYDPARHAVVVLSTFREMLHKWVIDVYLQTPHRGINDTPAHRWQSAMSDLPPPLPPSARDLDVVLGMTTQRVVFHYGIELEGLKYNGPGLGELRRRIGSGTKVELTFNPADLGLINVLDAERGGYISVSALDQAYAKGLSLWQHRVIRRYAQRQLNARTDLVALAQAKAEIRALVERDFNRKSAQGRKRHARFLEDYAGKSSPTITIQQMSDGNSNHCEVALTPITEGASAEANSTPPSAPVRSDLFSDDEILPVFEANLDLPSAPVELVEPAELHNA